MRGVAKQFAIVFFVGFFALAAALAYGMMTASLLSDKSFLVSLRSFGIGWMAAGMALWVILRREEGGRAEISLPLGLMVISGSVLLAFVAFVPLGAIAVYLIWVGLGLNLVALAIGVLAMLFAPAYPKPITVRWPEGGEEATAVHIPVSESHPEEPDDLTKLEGIGPKAQEVLRQAGITTFADIASRSSEDLKETLKVAKFRAPTSTESWPRQADLAAKGDWDGLKALKNQLKAGRET